MHEYQCPDCDRTFETERGAKAHHTRAHSFASADDLFTQVGAMTDIAFPNGVPSDRIIEVAQWQKTTMAMLQR